MLFEEINSIKYRRYTSDISEVNRHITLKKERAEEVNKVIAVANKGNKNFKLNWSWWAKADGQGLTEEVTWQEILKLSILRPGRAEIIYEGITPFSLRHGKHH